MGEASDLDHLLIPYVQIESVPNAAYFDLSPDSPFPRGLGI